MFMRNLERIIPLVDSVFENLLSQPLVVSRKIDRSPVSNIDIEMDFAIKKFLINLYPEIEILSEEDKVVRTLSESGYLAVVDPLDGTENFISKIPIWGVSISIWLDYKHVESLIYFPELGIKIISGDKTKIVDSQIVGISSSLPINTELSEFEGNDEIRIFGCATYNLYLVATGRLKKFINANGANTWDILAGINIALELGCEVLIDGKNYSGQFLDGSKKYGVEVFRR
jgi:myo-inositol-1(or 4)-monophosphatase